PGDVVLAVRELVTAANPRHALSFQLRRGEIVGVAGLVGAGRTEMLRALFGIDRPTSGQIVIDGQVKQLRSSIDAIRAGMALVPEDRRQQGLIVEMPIRPNISLASLWAHRRWRAFIDR